MADRGHALSASGSDTGTCSVDVAKLHFIFEETCLHVVVAPQHPCRLPFMRCTYSERLTYQMILPHQRHHHQRPLIRGPPEPMYVYRDTAVNL